MKKDLYINPEQIQQNRRDKLLFFVTWVLFSVLVGTCSVPREPVYLGGRSFTGHPVSDGVVVAGVLGLVVALAVLGIKRLYFSPSGRR